MPPGPSPPRRAPRSAWRSAVGALRAAHAACASCFGELRVDDLLVCLVRLEQLRVRADADDAAFVHDDDPVGVEDRADALGDDDHGRAGQLALQRGAQPRVRAEVERSEAVVEDVQRCALDERAGDSEALALAARNVLAALVDRRRRCLRRSSADELGRLGDVERAPDLLVGRVGVAVADVARDRAAEQEGASAGSRRSCARGPRGASRARRCRRSCTAPLGRVVEARNEVDQRRLAAAGAADDRRRSCPARR